MYLRIVVSVTVRMDNEDKIRREFKWKDNEFNFRWTEFESPRVYSSGRILVDLYTGLWDSGEKDLGKRCKS